MPAEPRDCPLGEIPALPPELIMVLRTAHRAGSRGDELEPPGRRCIIDGHHADENCWLRTEFIVEDLKSAGIHLPWQLINVLYEAARTEVEQQDL